MARTTISLSDALKAEMDAVGGEVNWSALAADAFLAEINKLKARKAATEGKKMDAAIDRLRKSKKIFIDGARDRGHADGTTWAMEDAEYGELKRLADSWPNVETTETADAHGAPGVFLGMVLEPDERADRMAINDFWVNLGKDSDDQDEYSSDYWDGFVEGALAVFEKVDE